MVKTLSGAAGVRWAPTGNYSLVFTKTVHTTIGELQVAKGKMAITNEVEIAAIYTEWRAKRGDMRKYSKSCVSKHLNNAKFRLRYRKVPF